MPTARAAKGLFSLTTPLQDLRAETLASGASDVRAVPAGGGAPVGPSAPAAPPRSP